MSIDSGRLKHLEMIQQVITRMNSHSFLIKGWSITLTSAILTLGAKENHTLIWVAFLPCLAFWLLDAFYLRQERLYRKLWDKKRLEPQENSTDFDMNAQPFEQDVDSWCEVAFSGTLRIFHGALFLLLCMVAAIIYLG